MRTSDTDAQNERRPHSTSARLGVMLIAILAAAVLGAGLGWQMKSRGTSALLVVNPCPREIRASIFDSSEFPGTNEHRRAEATLRTGVNEIASVRATEVGDDWSIELAHESGKVALRLGSTGWLDDGVAVIPALSCDSDDLVGRDR